MNKELVEIYNAITDLKLQLPDVSIQADLDFPQIVVVGGQVLYYWDTFKSKNVKCLVQWQIFGSGIRRW